MVTPIVVLNQRAAASLAAVAYATLLAQSMAVPVRLLEMPRESLSACELTTHLPVMNTTTQHSSRVTGSPTLMGMGKQEGELALVKQDALLAVMPVPVNMDNRVDIHSESWTEPAVWSLLQTTELPLLLVPQGLSRPALPLHMALVTDGEPFTLLHGQHLMHALLLTLPVHITVLHVPTPRSTSSPADALHTLLTCGLAPRYLTTATVLVVQAGSVKDGVLTRVQQIQADLLVLIVRKASLKESGLRMHLLAALVQQSPVPILLLLAT